MSSSLFTAQLHPGRGLGFLVLGSSLHDVLTRLKAEPQRFPKLDLLYSPTEPVKESVTLNLPANGLRLQFDGPEQRLRLIEVLDFTKSHIFFKEQNNDRDLVKPVATTYGTAPAAEPQGPTFKHVYHRFLGPTYDGEYVDGGSGQGTYVLSYPGVAFTFPMAKDAYVPGKDVMSLLSSPSPNGPVAVAMAVFTGDSWAQARSTLWTEILPSIKTFPPLNKGKDVSPDEISLVRIHGGGKLQLFRKWTASHLWIVLGQTTPQDLVAELGPPDAIYRKNEQRMYVHKIRTASNSRTRPNANDLKRHDDLTDTDQSSQAASDEEDSNEEALQDDYAGKVSGECFFNYFYLGFDILVSTPVAPSRPPPSQEGGGPPDAEPAVQSEIKDRLVATKVILHGNVPGSYPFNRHRRCRWEIAYLNGASPIDSETPFARTQESLRDEWKSIYASEAEAQQGQRGMVLNRGWGDSPGSSIELLGGWEGDGKGTAAGRAPGRGSEESTTTLFGFPGLVFEVLRNGFVSAVTVF